jgi:hypothetical protein
MFWPPAMEPIDPAYGEVNSWPVPGAPKKLPVAAAI